VKRQPQLLLEVEPISDARWTRIERELFAKLDEAHEEAPSSGGESNRRRALTWIAAVAAVAATVFAIIHSGRAMHDRVSLATTESTSEFTVGESSLTVAARSLVMVSGDDDHGIDVMLDRGTVTCEVAPRRGRPPFRLDAGEVRIRVVGTKFTVTREDGKTSVDVEHGAVEVAARGVVTVLHDGEHWPKVGGVLGPASDLERVPQSSVGSSEPVAPLLARSPVRGGHARRAVTAEAEPSTADDLPEDLPVEPEAAPPSPPPTSVTPSPQQSFEAASRKERTNPAEAEAIYRQLATGGTGWAPNALFALAQLEANRGHRGEAVRLLNTYLVRYPHGINVNDARELLRRIR
jgi:FecR protein